MPPGPQNDSAPSSWTQLERKESELWRLSLWFLGLLAAGLAASSWDRLEQFTGTLWGLPVGVVVLAAVFALYVWKKRQEMAELRGFVRALQERDARPPTEKQLEQLFQIVSQSQRGYRDLIDSFDDVVFSISPEGVIRTANRRFADVVETPISEVINKPLEELLLEPTRAAAEKVLPRFLEVRQWTGLIKVRARKTGGVRYFDAELRAIVRDNQVTGISGLARDVTRQRELETRFTELFETLHEGIYVCSPTGRLQDANPALAAMLGYSGKADLLAADLALPDLAPPLDRAKSAAGGNGVREITMQRRDGSQLICLVNTSPAFDASGAITRYQGTLLDVTRWREVERRLYQEQEFVRRLVDSFPDVILALDTSSRYTFVGPRVKDLLGVAPEQVLGQPFGIHVVPEDLARARAAFDGLLAGRAAFTTEEFRVRHQSGATRVVTVNASPLYDASGKIAGVIGSARDLTEYKKLEQQIIQSEKLAATGRLIAGVAHEINNPLTVILGASEMPGETAAENLVRRMEMIHQQAKRTAEIVQNLLAFSRPPAAGRNPLDLGQVVRQALMLSEYPLRVKNIAVDFVPAEVPAVLGDSSQLTQVFVNLLTNAQQAMTEERERGALRIRVGSDGAKAWASFQDDGPGIPPQVLPNIFDPFFTTKRPGRGTGLGLSICLSIVREHGGTIQAQNAPEGGAIFTVTLPVAEGATASGAGKIAAPKLDLRGRTLLAVDDEQGVQDLVRLAVKGLGADVDTCGNGLDAVALAAKKDYDVILCDLHMPGVSGQQVYETLAQIGRLPAGRFVIMTGEVLEAATRDFQRQNGIFLLQKPFGISELSVTLAKVLSR
jgi:PAS domain S-box-containing protein